MYDFKKKMRKIMVVSKDEKKKKMLDYMWISISKN